MSQEWLLRVFLAAPHASAWALAHSFRDVAGTDVCTVSRPAISKSQMHGWKCTQRWHTRLLVVVATHCASAHGNGARNSAVNAIFLVHVQDESDIRLRSGDARDGPSVPRRSRAPKVQAHVVTLVAGRSRREIPIDIEA